MQKNMTYILVAEFHWLNGKTMASHCLGWAISRVARSR